MVLFFKKNSCPGRPFKIKPSRPIYKTAFQHMSQDKNLSASMGILTSKFLQTKEFAKVKEYEEEMTQLVDIMTGHGADPQGYVLSKVNQKVVDQRMDYLFKRYKNLQ